MAHGTQKSLGLRTLYVVRNCKPLENTMFRKLGLSHIRFGLFTAVTMKNGVFWDVTQCGSFLRNVSSYIPEDAILLGLFQSSGESSSHIENKTKQTPWPLVRERTIPTDRPPLVDEI
jgi:hypothetical protein